MACCKQWTALSTPLRRQRYSHRSGRRSRVRQKPAIGSTWSGFAHPRAPFWRYRSTSSEPASVNQLRAVVGSSVVVSPPRSLHLVDLVSSLIPRHLYVRVIANIVTSSPIGVAPT